VRVMKASDSATVFKCEYDVENSSFAMNPLDSRINHCIKPSDEGV